MSIPIGIVDNSNDVKESPDDGGLPKMSKMYSILMK